MPAIALPESTHRLFDTDNHIVLVTVDEDGAPQASLVWAQRDGDQVLIGMEGYERKAANLRRDNRVTLVVEDDRPSRRGLAQYLVIRGTVELAGPEIPALDRVDGPAVAAVPRQGLSVRDRNSPTGVIARVTPEKITGEGPWAAKG